MLISDWSSDVCSSDLVERKWAGLRSFAPDRLPVYGFDPLARGFFWFAGQGGFGIQAALAAAKLGASLLTGEPRHASVRHIDAEPYRSEEHTSELQSLMRISYAVFCLKKKK